MNLNKTQSYRMLLAATLILCTVSPAWGKKPSPPPLSCDVCSSGCTYSSIQTAITNTSPGGTITVCEGLYDTESLVIDRAVTIQSAGLPENTTISHGGMYNPVVTFTPEATGAVLDGFTITGQDYYQHSGVLVNGSAPTINNCEIRENSSLSGGGIAIVDASPTISNSLIENNSAGNGGGIYSQNSSPNIVNTIIRNHSGITRGGGIYIDPTSDVTITGSTISDNDATAVSQSGGGIHCLGSMTMSDTSVLRNTASHHGGGITIGSLGGTSVTITSSYIKDNSVVHDHGGGIYVLSNGVLTIDRSYIQGNDTKLDGGGIYSLGTLTVDTCLISGNRAAMGGSGGAGGGLYANGTATVDYTTISGNQGYSGGGLALWGSMTNSTVYFNEPTNVYGVPVMSDSNVQDNPDPANNVIDGDPRFVIEPDPDSSNWHMDWPAWNFDLQADSPCIDTAAGSGTSTDIRGIVRPQPEGGNYDMGAYEYVSGIDITRALYDYVNDSLEVEATSPNGAAADLVLVGFGADRPMTWAQNKWQVTITWTPAPNLIMVCGPLDGCRTID